MIFNQQDFDVRLEWGRHGVEQLAPISDVIIIVDILSFSTSVDIATELGAILYPYRWKDESAMEYAQSIQAELADFNRTSSQGYTLSPTSMMNIKTGTQLVLPSPNGSTLTMLTGNTPTLCGCLRNAKAVATYAKRYGKKISIIAAGEQWPDKSLRIAFEDLIGAGAIISYLLGQLSPESKAGLTAFENLKSNLIPEIKNCCSGKELIDRGFEHDILLACALNTSDNVPVFVQDAYRGRKV